MVASFNALAQEEGYAWELEDILPQTLVAGEDAGALTAEGAKLLDSSGCLQAGIPLCPPEGDAGTGMAATNSVAVRTGNVSAGTSIFAMVVLEKPLDDVHTEIDIVTTPTGKQVAMVHCNNCTTDLDAWVKLFAEAIELSGKKMEKSALYDALYQKALQGDVDAGGLLTYNYYGGEPVVGIEEGRPLFVRRPDAPFSLANFMRSLVYGSMATLKIGMDILTGAEKVYVERLTGHGGLFKAKGVSQRFMAAALGTSITVMESAGEGGAWGIALLAAYMACREVGEPLEAYLANKVFAANSGITVQPDAQDAAGFAAYIAKYRACLAVEQSAVKTMAKVN
jgi:sugar (pentulose or hexulose) kinase